MSSRRPCWWSRSFSPLGTKLYFHVNSWRKNYIVLTFNIITFSRGCKPRITSYLIVGSIWPVTMPQRAYPWDLQFFLFLVVYSPPPGTQKETIPHPRAPDQPYTCVLGVHLFQSKIDFHQFFKIDGLSLILIPGAPLTYFSDGEVRRIFLGLTFWPKGIFLGLWKTPRFFWVAKTTQGFFGLFFFISSNQQ